MPELTKTENEWNLDDGGELHLVGGPHPYLWIGDKGGYFVDTMDVRQLRSLRDALTKALRRVGVVE